MYRRKALEWESNVLIPPLHLTLPTKVVTRDNMENFNLFPLGDGHASVMF